MSKTYHEQTLAERLEPDFEYWVRKEYWTLEEAICLSCNLDPSLWHRIDLDIEWKEWCLYRDLGRFEPSTYFQSMDKQTFDFLISKSDLYCFVSNEAHRAWQAGEKRLQPPTNSLPEVEGGWSRRNFFNTIYLKPTNYLHWFSERSFDNMPEALMRIMKRHNNKAAIELPLINKDHPFFSTELAMAIAAWKALYQDGAMKTNRGHKEQIAGWLKEHYPAATKGAIERIATVVNPNKKGGAPSAD